MATPRPLSKRLAVTAGYATAALAIAAVSPVARRHPVHATAIRAAGHVRVARSGLDRWLDLQSSPPPTLGELLTEAVLGALASRPTSD